MPDAAIRNGDVHLPEEFFGMVTDGAELFVDVSDGALDVGNGDNRVLIERKFLVCEFLERSLAGGEAFLHRFLGLLTFRNVARNFRGADNRTRTIADRRNCDGDVDPGSVPPNTYGLEVLNTLALLDARQNLGLFMHALWQK